LMPITCTIS